MGSAELPCLIVGAGPSGLSAARALAEQGIDYVIADEAQTVGGIWAGHEKHRTGLSESTSLITSKEMTAFDRFPAPRDWPLYASRESLRQYLESFAQSIDLKRRARLGCAVDDVRPSGKGTWSASFSDGVEKEFFAVICASGTEIQPRRDPEFRRYTGFSIHSASYWSPRDIPAGRVLVVGSGNSAAGIALDLARSGREVDVSFSRGRWIVPLLLGGKPSDFPSPKDLDLSGTAPGLKAQRRLARTLLDTVGDLRAFGLPEPVGLPLESTSIVGTDFVEEVAAQRLRVLPAIDRIEGRTIFFQDTSVRDYPNLILATGYRSAIEYLPDPLSSWDRFLLGIFNRDVNGLFALGFLRSDIGGFWTRDCGAKLVAKVISLLAEGRSDWVNRFLRECGKYSDDMSGGARLQRASGQPLAAYGPLYFHVLRSLGEGIEVEIPINEKWRGVHD
ncbi:flavin-containing monooxygenase [Streptomyces sp. FL07-04A]|uniref:flavin-containing monooxygenase n=1 Tax=Streptomyces sp. FL07-04A TaxID=3028658 RepID=UPI0029B8CF02|nr:NAD(P)-binding domain-containing protein [Streptomyces sp. FL07-04A]MDX3579189.1 NAD(P)-binding domain-containing protein [Streptomyces sp. FL07-04A]